MTHPPGNPFDDFDGPIHDPDDNVDGEETQPRRPSLSADLSSPKVGVINPPPLASSPPTVSTDFEARPDSMVTRAKNPTLPGVKARPLDDPTGEGEQLYLEVPTESVESEEDIEAKAPTEPVEEVKSGAVIFGMSGSGKTTLLRGIKQACDHDPEDEPRKLTLRFFPEGETSRLYQKAVNILWHEEDEIGDDRIHTYPFGLEFEESVFGFPIREAMPMVVRDGPGGALFPVASKFFKDSEFALEYRKELLAAGKEATVLVLVIDVSGPEQINHVVQYMPEILEEMAVSSTRDRFVQSSVGKWVNKRVVRLVHPKASTTERMRTRELTADRFLILLNKIDKLCQGWADQPGNETVMPAAVAEAMDPVQQAIEILQIGFLKAVHQYLRPQAKLAVGLTSACGFYGNGLVFDRLNLPSDKLKGPWALHDWRPYGLRDALYFILTGRARGRVALIEESMLRDPTRRPKPYRPQGTR